MGRKIGFKHSEATIEKFRKAKLKNPVNYWLGKKRSEEDKEKMRGIRKKVISYRGLHHWVKRYKGTPKKCEHCGKEKSNPKSIHWANKSHKYLRNLTDWIQLCVLCHKKYDIQYKKHAINKTSSKNSQAQLPTRKLYAWLVVPKLRGRHFIHFIINQVLKV